MAPSRPTATSLRVADLQTGAPTPFELRPDRDTCAALAQELDLYALRKLSFAGTLRPIGDTDWLLEARLGATVVQPCVTTLEPVTTRIDTDVIRHFLREMPEPEAPEVEMEDDTAEELGAWIDPAAVMAEALALAVPDYPRKEGATLEPVQVTEAGKTPLSDDDLKPFAGLAALKDQLTDKKD
ncbi:DUF177 domain-containing protein [Sulfitobacter albidus]|uniref:DUF177 domain-containing protein n=1 Tax=Sulfitobacter albidus TaxID=2829501 RepID=A0A975JG20_9RHOB|nr:DUF177 domain-containing protein [Sulfitobacter albidus]QUJ77798.1 DUF177 domain-containing protein [Sulfitobacter albidus]